MNLWYDFIAQVQARTTIFHILILITVFQYFWEKKFMIYFLGKEIVTLFNAFPHGLENNVLALLATNVCYKSSEPLLTNYVFNPFGGVKYIHIWSKMNQKHV